MRERALGTGPQPRILQVADRVQFEEEAECSYRVRCVSDDNRYAICTRPFNLRKTVIYTIVDFEEGKRGPDDRVFCEGYETQSQIGHAMQELIAGRMQLSYRHSVDLNIVTVTKPTGRQRLADQRALRSGQPV